MPQELHQAHPTLEALEDRTVPATVSVHDGTLFVTGTGGGDTVLISQDANEIIISQPGQADVAIQLGLVQNIVVTGFGNEDAFANLSVFPASGAGNAPGTLTAFGQPGSFMFFLNRFSPREGTVGGELAANLQATLFSLAFPSTGFNSLGSLTPASGTNFSVTSGTDQLSLSTVLSGQGANAPLSLFLSPSLGPTQLLYVSDANGLVARSQLFS
jgi:hypothetical protein